MYDVSQSFALHSSSADHIFNAFIAHYLNTTKNHDIKTDTKRILETANKIMSIFRTS